MKCVYVEMCSRNSECRIENPVGNEKVLIFDIDYCLYHSPEMEEWECNHIREQYMARSKRTELDWINDLKTFNIFRQIFFHVCNVHPRDFGRENDLPDLGKYLVPDAELREVLLEMPFRKFCFSNGGTERAGAILRYLNLEDLFEAVICTDASGTEFISKPMPESFEFAERVLGISTRSNVYFFDDTEKNVVAASKFGWNAFQVKGNLKEKLRELFK